MIIGIVGPTGVGKTKMSVELAKKYKAIVVNCDAMQVYKGMDIGTAKIKEEEKEGVPHLLFNIREITEDYSVYDYQGDVRKIIKENQDKNIILVGGTGLYLKAALYDYRFYEESGDKEDLSTFCNEELYEMVKEIDPKTKIHPNNRVRLERFLQKENHDVVEPIKLYDHVIIGLTTDRENLYKRLDDRVDEMMDAGLLEEVKSLYDKGIRSRAIMTGIDYKELYEYFDGKISLDEAVEKIKLNTRHYAKRQYTFFNNQLDVKWFSVNYTDFKETILEVSEYLDEVLK